MALLLVLAGCTAPSTTKSQVPASRSQEHSVASELPPITGGNTLAPTRYTLTVGPRVIRLDGAEIAPLPADMSHGLDAAYKRSGPSDLYLVPLGNALSRARDRRGPKSGGDAARIEMSPNITYRVVVEVAFTLGQNEVGTLHIVAPSAGGDVPQGSLAEFVTVPPKGAPGGPTVIMTTDGGLMVKARGSNIAPGCKDIGPGVTIPGRDGQYVLADLAACLKHLKKLVPEIERESNATITAGSSTAVRDLIRVMNTVRGEHRDLFPDLLFGIMR